MADDEDMGQSPHEVNEDLMATIRRKFSGVSSVLPARRKRASSLRKIDRTTDGRCLRATGRTDQFNFKTTPERKQAALKAAAADGITVTEWMERAMDSALMGNED